jgi:hypothetical protein
MYLLSSTAVLFGNTSSHISLIEQDWLRQAEAWIEPPKPAQTFEDARGAVDGIKNGTYGFHVGQEPNPWWQVDLGIERPAVSRIVIYNRLDYAPGLHNSNNLIILSSNDCKDWTIRYRNPGKFFGGVSKAPPLEVRFDSAPLQVRFIRLQIPSMKPIFFHLDEVEIYGPQDPKHNLALGKPVDQSSISPWSTAKARAQIKPVKVFPTVYFLKRGHKLANDLQSMGVDTRSFTLGLKKLAVQLKKLDPDASEETRRDLYLQVRSVVRKLAFTNPLLNFSELLFVKRFTQETYPDVCLNHMPWVSRPGGDICIARLSSNEVKPSVRNLLKGALGPGHVHGMDLWWDADRVVFGYARAKSDQPPAGWKDRRTNYELRRTQEPIHIFEIGIKGEGLRQITDGQWSDLDPTYSPNGDIVFVSERCGCSLQCNEYDKDETSCNLFVCRPDGSNIRWMSVSKDGDYLPHCLDDGTIGYTRWEYQERNWANIQSIWIIRPDGTGADALFKQHLNDPWALEDVRSIPGTGTGKLVSIATGHHTLAVGPVVIITPSVGMNNPQAIRIVTPGVKPPEGGMSGTPAEQGGVFDRGGFYSTPWPLSDKYFLASYSYSNQQTEPAGYGIYLVDVFGTKELIYRDPKISSFIPIPLRQRPRPPILPDLTDPNKDFAICSVTNVTHGVDGVTADQARYLRISHRLQWPYDNRYGGHRYMEKAYPNNWTPARVIGTVPIETDGSAHFRVPIDTPVYFQLLDENHMELRRMRSFISFQPGEVRSCVGCHETRAEAPIINRMTKAQLRQPSEPVPPAWGDQPIHFLRDIQPIFNRHCVSCHSGLKPAGGLDFHSGLTLGPEQGPGHSEPVPGYGMNRAFETIIQHKLVSWSPVQGDARITLPLQFGSHKSKLVQVLRNGTCSKRAKLSPNQWRTLVTWIDLNAPYHDRFVNKRQQPGAYNLPNDQALLKKISNIHKLRCNSCHDPVTVTRTDWIDILSPHLSLFLTAPLAKTAGGSGKCSDVIYKNTNDPDYQIILKLIDTAVKKAWEFPRRDLKALKPFEPVVWNPIPEKSRFYEKP